MLDKLVHARCRLPARRWQDRELLNTQRDMDQIFDDLLRGFGFTRPLEWALATPVRAAFTPRVDVSETEKEVRVSAELPGLDRKDVSVELDEDELTVSGEKKDDAKEIGKNWYRREQSYGTFSRVIPLPATVEADKAKATFKKGVLTITLPKREEEQPKRKSIEIEAA